MSSELGDLDGLGYGRLQEGDGDGNGNSSAKDGGTLAKLMKSLTPQYDVAEGSGWSSGWSSSSVPTQAGSIQDGHSIHDKLLGGTVEGSDGAAAAASNAKCPKLKQYLSTMFQFSNISGVAVGYYYLARFTGQSLIVLGVPVERKTADLLLFLCADIANIALSYFFIYITNKKLEDMIEALKDQYPSRKYPVLCLALMSSLALGLMFGSALRGVLKESSASESPWDDVIHYWSLFSLTFVYSCSFWLENQEFYFKLLTSPIASSKEFFSRYIDLRTLVSMLMLKRLLGEHTVLQGFDTTVLSSSGEARMEVELAYIMRARRNNSFLKDNKLYCFFLLAFEIGVSIPLTLFFIALLMMSAPDVLSLMHIEPTIMSDILCLIGLAPNILPFVPLIKDGLYFQTDFAWAFFLQPLLVGCRKVGGLCTQNIAGDTDGLIMSKSAHINYWAMRLPIGSLVWFASEFTTGDLGEWAGVFATLGSTAAVALACVLALYSADTNKLMDTAIVAAKFMGVDIVSLSGAGLAGTLVEVLNKAAGGSSDKMVQLAQEFLSLFGPLAVAIIAFVFAGAANINGIKGIIREGYVDCTEIQQELMGLLRSDVLIDGSHKVSAVFAKRFYERKTQDPNGLQALAGQDFPPGGEGDYDLGDYDQNDL